MVGPTVGEIFTTEGCVVVFILGWPVGAVPAGERVEDIVATVGWTVGELFMTVGCCVVVALILGSPVGVVVAAGESVGDATAMVGSTVGELFATVGCVVVFILGWPVAELAAVGSVVVLMLG